MVSNEGAQPSPRRFRYEIWLGAIGITTIAICVRFVMLDRYIAPPSGDFGNYLTIANIILGNDVTGYGLRYPPLFFLLLIPCVNVLGPTLGLKLAAAVVASSSCVPMFLLMVRRTNYQVAVAATVLLTFSQAMAEMTAWGGSPNFLAITFIIFALYFLDRAFSPLRSMFWNGVASGVFFGLTFETHHLSFLVLALTMALFFGIMLVWSSNQGRIRLLRPMIIVGASAFVTAIPGIPVYLRIQGSLSASLGALGPASVESVLGPGGLGYIAGSYWVAWTTLFALGAVAIIDGLLYKRTEKHLSALLIAASVAPLILGILVIKEAPGRVFVFMIMPLLVGLGLYMVQFQIWISSLGKGYGIAKRFRELAFTLLAADIVLMSAAGVQWMSYAVDWYHPIEDDDMEALDWIRDYTAPDAVFATSGKVLSGHREGDRIGWWIEGYAERKSVMAGSERFRLFGDEQESARDMNRFFSGTHVLENGYLMVTDQYPLEYRGNPEIAARRLGNYEPILFLNDALHEITYLDYSISPDPIMSTLAGASATGLEIVEADTTITATVAYSTPDFVFERTTRIDYGEKGVTLEMHLRPLNESVLSNLELLIWCPHGNELSDIISSETTTGFRVSGPFVPSTYTTVSTLGSGGLLTGHEFSEEDPIWDLPVIRLSFDTAPDRLDLILDIQIDPGELDDLSPLEYYNGYDLLAKHDVDYIYVSLTMGLEAERMMKDFLHFRPVFRNDGVVIFQVLD
ncbi:MAG TPA: hypothetical protein VF374_02715 [Thermoplasmata archaeon]